MTTLIRWLNNRLVLTLLICVGTTFDLFLLGREYDLNKSEWASWVQAIGSIAAILGLVWAALHASTTGRREASKSAREASIAQLIYLRSVLASAFAIVRDLEYHAQNIAPDKVADLRKSLSPLLQTVEGLAGRVTDHEMTRLIALTYEHILFCQVHTASVVSGRATALIGAQSSAAFARIHIEKTLDELDQTGIRLGAPPRPRDTE